MLQHDYSTNPSMLDSIRAKIGAPADVLLQFYGIAPARGFVRCPFHQDKTPSMKVDSRRVHCFGCGWSGDSLDLWAAANGVTLQEAIRRLRDDTDVDRDRWREQAAIARRKRQIEEAVKIDAQTCFAALCRKRHTLARLLRLAELSFEIEENQEHFWAIVEEMGILDQVLPEFYTGQASEDLQGLRMARGLGLWGK